MVFSFECRRLAGNKKTTLPVTGSRQEFPFAATQSFFGNRMRAQPEKAVQTLPGSHSRTPGSGFRLQRRQALVQIPLLPKAAGVCQSLFFGSIICSAPEKVNLHHSTVALPFVFGGKPAVELPLAAQAAHRRRTGGVFARSSLFGFLSFFLTYKKEYDIISSV